MKSNQQNSSNSLLQKKIEEIDPKTKFNIRELMLEFHSYNQKDFELILEFCNNNLAITQKFLRESSRNVVRNTLRKFMNGEIDVLCSKEESKEQEICEKNKSTEIFVPTGPNFFEKLRIDSVFFICDFLDPISLGRVSRVCKLFSDATKKPFLYKKLCALLYRVHPLLPEKSPFLPVVPLMMQAGFGEFTIEVVEQAQQDIRPLVWLPDLQDYSTPGVFFKKHKDFRNLFYNGPRVRYGGLYLMKEKYVRAGAKENNQNYDPYHLIEFYRYFRFFPDGLAMSCLSVNKLNKEKLKKIFRIKQEQLNEDQLYDKNSTIKSLLYGEFIVKESKVHMRMAAKTTVYELEIEIRSSKPGMFDELQLLSHSMRLIGMAGGAPVPSQCTGDKIMKFMPMSELKEDLELQWRHVVT